MNPGKAWRSRILVADDEQLIARTLGEILVDAEYDVITAFSGEEAVEKAAMFRPDLLITDISMGAMNGIEAAIQVTIRRPECKVLFLSGHASMSEIIESSSEPLAHKFMSKPACIPDLLNTIASMLPIVAAANDHVAVEVERDPIPLHSLPLGELVRLDPSQLVRPHLSSREPEQRMTVNGAGYPVCMAGEASATGVSDEHCLRNSRHSAENERRPVPFVPITSAA